MKRILFFLGLFLALAPGARADTLGQATTFHTNTGYDAQSAATISATLRVGGQRAYFYVDERVWNALSSNQQNQYTGQLQVLANQFDQVIYPTETNFWGHEALPGVNGDDHVTLVFEKMGPGNGGYFESINGYPRRLAPDSNQRNMFFVNADSVPAGTAGDYIAHEFQHLISFNQKELSRQINEDTWLNESRSEYSLTLTGLNDPFGGSSLERRALAFLRAPSDSLVAWPNTATDYAIATVFSHYLVERFGLGILADTLHSPSLGVASLEAWLAAHGQGQHFGQVFDDWMAAVNLNDRSLGVQYGYLRPGLNNLHVQPPDLVILDGTNLYSRILNLGEWQPYWLEFVVPRGSAVPPSLLLQLSGQTAGTWSGAVMAKYLDGHTVVSPWTASGGQANLVVPTTSNSSPLDSVVLALTQGSLVPVGERETLVLPVSLRATMTDTFQAPILSSNEVQDGDLIRHNSENEIYVVWGKYRRYLTPDILKLYGFENRRIISVGDEVFNRYSTSIYVRIQGDKKVYAVWPDGTKHWLNITAAQWDASGRAWDAIFTVNAREVAAYLLGPAITR